MDIIIRSFRSYKLFNNDSSYILENFPLFCPKCKQETRK
ncbi:cysteine-rich KTR domain-containing protein [Paenibacillus sp. D2_2]